MGGQEIEVSIEACDFVAGAFTSVAIPHRGSANCVTMTIRQPWSSRYQGYFKWGIFVGDLEVAECDGSSTGADVKVTIFGVRPSDQITFRLTPLLSQRGKESWARASRTRIFEIETRSIMRLPESIALYSIANHPAVTVKGYTSEDVRRGGSWREQLDLTLPSRQQVNSDELPPENALEKFKNLKRGLLELKPHPQVELDPFDWMAPEIYDNNWHFQHHTLRFLNPVRHLAQQGNEAARQFWLEGVRTWSEANVPPVNSLSKWAWVDMVDGLRAIQLSLGASLAGPNDRWFRSVLEVHQQWLLDERNLRARNHGMHQRAGLFVVSCALRDEGGKRIAAESLFELFRNTFDGEGMDDEGAPAYLLYNVKWWTQVFRRLEAEEYEIPGDITESISRSKRLLKLLETPSGTLPPIGDTSMMARIPKRLGDGEFFSTRELEDQRFSDLEIVNAGFAVFRDKAAYGLVRFGQEGKGHHHDDKGSMLISEGGISWLTDPGFFGYQAQSSMRKRTLKHSAHNVLSVPGFKRWSGAPVELIGHSNTSDASTVWLRTSKGFRDADFDLHRYVARVKTLNSWLVLDWLEGESTESVAVEQNWLVAPNVQVSIEGNTLKLVYENSSITLQPFVQSGAAVDWRIHEATDTEDMGWIGTGYGKRLPGTQITFSATLAMKEKIGLWISPGSRLCNLDENGGEVKVSVSDESGVLNFLNFSIA